MGRLLAEGPLVQEFNRDLSIAVIKLHASHNRRDRGHQLQEAELKPGVRDEQGITILEVCISQSFFVGGGG